MYCKSCKYTSFDHLQSCPRCGQDWSEVQKALNLDWLVEPASQPKGQASPYLNPEEFAFQDQQETSTAAETDQDDSELEFASMDEAGQLQAGQSGLIDFDLEEDSEGSARVEDDEIVISEPEIDLEAETGLLDFSDHEDHAGMNSEDDEISFPELDELFSVRNQPGDQGQKDSVQAESSSDPDDDLDMLLDVDLDDEGHFDGGEEEPGKPAADQPSSRQAESWASDEDDNSDLSTLFDDIEIEIDSDPDQGPKDS